MSLGTQIIWLFVLAIPIACIAWTVTHEEIFKEPREYCINCSRERKTLVGRKFFYIFTCEYCFSHYVTIAILFITNYQLLLPGWRGYLIAGFALVWIANLYMCLYGLFRTDLKMVKTRVQIEEEKLKEDGEVKSFQHHES
ncbi:MAG: hypothetical protein ABIQ74_05665 [Chitinophagales bacterium]